MQYLKKGFSQNLINRQKEIDDRLMEYLLKQPHEKIYKTRWIRFHAIRTIISTSFSNSKFEPSEDLVEVNHPLFSKTLTEAKVRVEAWGGRLYFVYLPGILRYRSDVDHNKYLNKSKVIELVKGLGISVIDTHKEVFVDYPDPTLLFSFGLGHINADGYIILLIN